MGRKSKPLNTPQQERTPAIINILVVLSSVENSNKTTVINTKILLANIKRDEPFILFVKVNKVQKPSRGKVKIKANVPQIVSCCNSLAFTIGIHKE